MKLAMFNSGIVGLILLVAAIGSREVAAESRNKNKTTNGTQQAQQRVFQYRGEYQWSPLGFPQNMQNGLHRKGNSSFSGPPANPNGLTVRRPIVKTVPTPFPRAPIYPSLPYANFNYGKKQQPSSPNTRDSLPMMPMGTKQKKK